MAWPLAADSRGAIDLTAVPQEYVGEGIKYQKLIFTDDSRRILMELPRGWNFRGEGANSVRLLPPTRGFAEGVIQSEPPGGSVAMDEAGIKRLQEQVLGSLPPDSQEGSVLEVKQGPDGPDGRPAVEVVVSYKVLGTVFMRSVLVVDLSDSRLRFQFTAPKTEFQALNWKFRHAFQSWEWK